MMLMLWCYCYSSSDTLLCGFCYTKCIAISMLSCLCCSYYAAAATAATAISLLTCWYCYNALLLQLYSYCYDATVMVLLLCGFCYNHMRLLLHHICSHCFAGTAIYFSSYAAVVIAISLFICWCYYAALLLQLNWYYYAGTAMLILQHSYVDNAAPHACQLLCCYSYTTPSMLLLLLLFRYWCDAIDAALLLQLYY